MRRRSLRLWFSIVMVGFVLFSFQNCSGGFESAAPFDPLAVASPTATEDVLEEQGTVPAKVLLTNPVVASGNFNFAFDGNYGEFLTNRLLFEPLPNLTYLATEHFKISTDDEYPNELAMPAPSLEFMPSDPEFLQVNVFFHLQRFTRVLQRLQIFPTNFIADLDVKAHCTTGEFSENNAYFSPEEKLLCMGYANLPGLKLWSAEDSDVIIHEFGHAINSAAATDDVLLGSLDTWAIDEGFADVWAFLANNQPKIANWFARGIMTVFQPTQPYDNEGLRNLSSTVNYPTSLQYAPHDDGVVFSSVFYDLKSNGVPMGTLAALAIRVLENIQLADNNSDVARYMLEEAVAVGIERSRIIDALNRRGLYRKDSLQNVTLPADQVLVVDNHAFGILENGNCNRALDVNELAILIPNFANSGAALGAIQYRVTSSSADLVVVPGGDFGNISSLKQSSNMVNTIPRNSLREINFIFPAIIVAALRAGTYQLTFTVEAFNSLDSEVVQRTYTVPITVGTAANVEGPCSGNLETSIWP